MHLNMCWTNPFHATWDTKYISTCVDQTYLMRARTRNVSQHVLTKRLPCQRRHKMYLLMYWPYPNYASEDTKCISTYVDYTRPMQTRTQIDSQLVLTKPIPCQLGHKIYLNLCWPNPSHASEDLKWISTFFDHTMPARHKMYLNLWDRKSVV